jgi:iron complex transport system permease protein
MIKNAILNDGLVKTAVLDALAEWDAPSESEKEDSGYEDYRRYIMRKWLFMALCVAIIVVVSGYALTVGGYDIGFFETFEIIWDHLTGNIGDVNKDYVIVQLRSPRIIIGILTGAGLASAGVVMQSTLMNPLADSYTTGVSSGALFGASLSISLGINAFGGNGSLVINAFLFSLIPMFVIISVAKIKKTSPTVMIMAGIAVMYIFDACTTVVRLWSEPNALQELYIWSVGSLTHSDWSDIPTMVVIVIPCIVALQLMTRHINVLASGDDNAKSLGVNAERLRSICMLISALMVATIVCFTGLIGFVGLVAPHIVRIFIGADNRFLLPASMLFGAALLLLADLVGKTIIAPAVLEVGVITSFIGGPMFLWILLRKNSKVWG